MSSRRSTQGEGAKNALCRVNGRAEALPEPVEPIDFAEKRLAKRWPGLARETGAPTAERAGDGRALRPETVAAQAGGGMDAGTGGIVPPIHVATTFVRDPDNQYRRGYSYGRSDNATVRQARSVHELEGSGDLAVCVGDGGGDRRVSGADGPRTWWPPRHVLGPAEWLPRTRRATVSRATSSTPARSERSRSHAAGATRLVWTETPANPNGTSPISRSRPHRPRRRRCAGGRFTRCRRRC